MNCTAFIHSILFSTVLLFSYPWPIRDFNGPHKVNAVIGDFRKGKEGDPNYPRFHNGIDIPAIDAQVYSVESGTAKYTSGLPGVRVENYAYVHLTNRIRENDPVIGILIDSINPTLIGRTDSENHVHLITGPAGGPYSNPLSFNGGPANYSDTGRTIVYSIDFWRQGSEFTPQQLQPEVLYSKVDICGRCQDRQTAAWPSPTATGGIYRWQWIVRPIGGTSVYGPFEAYSFTQVGPPNDGDPVRYIYDVSRSIHANSDFFFYWATNVVKDTVIGGRSTKIVKDSYWNTKLRQGQTTIDSNARINTEAEFPDGDYRVWVMAYDIKDNGGDTVNRRGAEDEDVSLDNFVPFVEQLVITQEEKVVKYDGRWELVGDQLRLIKDADNYASLDKPLEFYLFFDQKMNTNIYPEIIVAFNNGVTKTAPRGRWVNEWNYATTTDADFIPEGAVEGGVQISNAQDQSGNLLDGNPQSVAYLDAGGWWRLAEEPPDKSHKFRISGPPQITSTDPVNAATDVDVCKEISIAFNKRMDTASVEGALAVSGCEIRQFKWREKQDLTVRVLDPRLRLLELDTTGFDYVTKYKVTVYASARDSAGATLDGNRNGISEGRPIDDYVCSLTTERPEVYFTGYSYNPMVYYRVVDSNDFYSDAQRKVRIRLAGEIVDPEQAWNVFATVGTFTLSPHDRMRFPCTIEKKIEPVHALQLSFNLVYKDSVWDVAERIYYPAKHRAEDFPGGDRPDENNVITDPRYPTPWYLDTESSIGIYARGFFDGVGHLLGKYRINTCLVREDLAVLGAPERRLENLAVLVLPSGSLYGMEGSEPFRARLRDFVQQGGAIICLTQQRGSDWGILPGSEGQGVGGYGWRQDQSCFHRAGYYSDWHTILAGQDTVIVDAGIDGFLTRLPNGGER